MPAPDYETLYDLKDTLEGCVRKVFEARQFKVYTRLDAFADFQKVRPRLEVNVAIGGQNGHCALCPDHHQRNDQWFFDLAFQLVTVPIAKAAENKLQTLFQASVRRECAIFAQNSWNDGVNFPYHAISERLTETGTTDHYNNETKFIEYSTMTFRGVVAIRKAAWPLTTEP